MSKIKWINLKSYKCPKCGSYLNENPRNLMHECMAECGFKIADEKLTAIIKSKDFTFVSDELANLSALNNL